MIGFSKHRWLVIAWLLMTFVSLSAQKQRINNYEKLDTCLWQIVYDYTSLDTILSTTQSVDMMLQIGEEYQKFYSEKRYEFDYEVWKHGNMMEPEEAQKLFFTILPAYSTIFIRHTASNSIQQTGSWFSFFYNVKDNVNIQDWNMAFADTITICGYVCRKATCTFRGRNWTAWYAEALNIDAGPWKLCGLPGVILKADADEGLIQFEAKSVEMGNTYPIESEEPFSSRRLITRQKFIELEYLRAVDFNSFAKIISYNSNSSKSDSSPIRYFYCPLEKE